MSAPNDSNFARSPLHPTASYASSSATSTASPPNHSNFARSPLHSTVSYTSSSATSTVSPQREYGPTTITSASPQLSNHRPQQHITLPPASFVSPFFHNHSVSGPPSLDPLPLPRASPSTSSIGVGPPPLLESQISLSNGSYQQHKRAYRQRRKDPSCDACRERKVKCDATETTSCSECSSRNVKCQFTKETNRRMSSIKQVQDLEKQVSQYKREIAHLRSMYEREIAHLRALVDGRDDRERRNGEVPARPPSDSMTGLNMPPPVLPPVMPSTERERDVKNSRDRLSIANII